MNSFINRTRLSATSLSGLILSLIFGIALFIRAYFPHDNVFVGDWVRFKWYDPWYHMRLVENLLHHFPSRIYFDPYTYYPHGQDVFFAPFPDILIGGIAWIIGLGSPSVELMETVGAYVPAVVGSLVSIPVYFIGKELFNRKVGLIAALLAVILPGQFLLRSLLGFTDHHVFETFFSSMVILFMILAIKNSGRNQITFKSLAAKDWKSLKKPLIYSLLTGITLGLYLLSWVGGALIVFIIFLYTIFQFIIDYMRGRTTDYLCIIGVVPFFIAMLMVLPFLGQFGMDDRQVASLFIGIITFVSLSVLARLISRKNLDRIYFPISVVSFAAIGVLFFYFIDRSLLNAIVDNLGVLRPHGGALTIGEVKPLLWPEGSFTLHLVWREFTTTFYISIVSLIVIIYLVIKRGAPEKTLLMVWCLIMLMAVFGQNRFSYYYCINAAMLTAYLCWRIPSLPFFRQFYHTERIRKPDLRGESPALKETAKLSRKAKRKKGKMGQSPKKSREQRLTSHPVTRYVFVTIVVLVIFFAAFFPNISKAIDVAKQPSFPRDDWHEALVWMRDNTPDPFDNPDFFYETYERPPAETNYDYPESAYGIMNWWDYGHWITYIAHRIPVSNPHQQGALEAAEYFIENDVSMANRIMDDLDARYVIIDLKIAMHEIGEQTGVYGNFYALPQWVEMDLSEFLEDFWYEGPTGRLERITLYYPRYYESMIVRLYSFEGRQVIPYESTHVIAYQDRVDSSGTSYKKITEHQVFTTYEEALEFIELSGPSKYRIVGYDAFSSPVPLEKLENYTLVHKSPSSAVEITDITGEMRTISEVEIFEYIP